uniref:Uncharacterized protein n=1 Tax=Steinernema glaseri TaxID=37863 RepID=A0A1I7ZMT6_9BILA
MVVAIAKFTALRFREARDPVDPQGSPSFFYFLMSKELLGTPKDGVQVVMQHESIQNKHTASASKGRGDGDRIDLHFRQQSRGPWPKGVHGEVAVNKRRFVYRRVDTFWSWRRVWDVALRLIDGGRGKQYEC